MPGRIRLQRVFLNRQDLQNLSGIRVEEAETLLDRGYYSGAYYLLGYAVECALKACVAKGVREYDFPDLRRVRNSHSHDLQQLVKEAGLEAALQNEAQNNPSFAQKWLLTQQWNVESRYQSGVSRENCQDFHAAVTDSGSGVLQWIMMRW